MSINLKFITKIKNDSDFRIRVGFLLMIPISLIYSFSYNNSSIKLIFFNALIIYITTYTILFAFLFTYLWVGLPFILFYYSIRDKLKKYNQIISDYIIPFLIFYFLIFLFFYFFADVNIFRIIPRAYDTFLLDENLKNKVLAK